MASRADEAASNDNFTPIGVFDATGNAFYRGPPVPNSRTIGPKVGGTDGGDPMIEIAGLKARMNGAFAWLGILTVASGVAFLFLVGQVSDVRKEVSVIQSTEAAQAATTTAMQATLGRIENKLDESNDVIQTKSTEEPNKRPRP